MKRSTSTIECLRDAWLSGLLGKASYHWSLSSLDGLLQGKNPDALCQALPDLSEPCFVDVKVPVSDVQCIAPLMGCGFSLVETSVLLEKAIKAGAGQRAGGCCHVRWAAPDDLPAVRAIAGASFLSSRFHQDPLVPMETAHAIKSAWASNYFAGKRGDAMVVAELDGRAAGFLLLLRPEARLQVIDLIAVSADARHRGVASAMIDFAECHAGGADTFRVGTQIINRVSLRLYGQAGFRFSRAQHVLHYHGV